MQFALAILFVSDPEEYASAADRVLTEIYSLTAAEARIASLLCEGLSMADVCAELAITANTARTHLKRIFSKTGSTRQSELVKLVLKGPATLRTPSPGGGKFFTT